MNAVDTNVLVYACDRSEPRRQKIAQDVLWATRGGVLLWQVGCEFVAAARKLASQGFTTKQAWARLEEYRAFYRLMPPSPSILFVARELHVNHGWSFWDAMLVAAAQEAGVTRLYSEDLPGRAPPDGLEIVNPFA